MDACCRRGLASLSRRRLEPAAHRFYDSAASLDILNFFKSQAVGPEQLPDRIFAAIGRTVWQDIGPTAVGFRCAGPWSVWTPGSPSAWLT